MKTVATAIVYNTDPEFTKLVALFDSTEAAGTDFYVIAVDAKSIPGTEQFCRDRLAGRVDVFPYTFDDDFAAARNLTLARVPAEALWWFWIDSDDTLEMAADKTWPEYLEEVPDGYNAIGFLYDYERDQYGNKTTTHRRGRLYRNSLKWEWRGMVHEDVYPIGHVGRALAIKSEDFLWVHHTDGRGSSYERNMRILKKMLAADPDDARTWYCLGNALFAGKQFTKATEAFERYVAISGWPLEKWAALIYQAIAFRHLGIMDRAIDSDTKAMLLMPELADSYFGLGETHARLGQWRKALHFGELGMKSVSEGGIPDADMFINVNAYAYKPYMWMADCYLELGQNQRALDCLETAAKSRPEQDLLRGIDHIKWAMSRQRIIDNGVDLAAGLLRRNEPMKAKAILENLPAGASENLSVNRALFVVNDRLAHLSDRTAYANLYFNEEERSDPLDVLKNIDDLPRMKWALRRLKAAGAKRILDMGIGDGTQALYFAQNGIEVVGVDVDRRRVKDCNFAAVRAGFLSMKEVDFGDEDEPYRVEVPDIRPDSMIQFHYCSAEELSEQVKALGPFDAVVASELIEHVADPGLLLDRCEEIAPRIILTTPDGAYDGPQEHNLGHVRAWSQREFTQLVGRRGRLVEIHKVNPPLEVRQQNIVCEYLVGERVEGKTASIWCPPTVSWTPDSIREGGIGGSETAVIRVSEELAKKGWRVTVYAQTEGVWDGVRYAQFKDFRPHPCDLFVAWRQLGPTTLMDASNKFIWAHDVHFGEATEEQLKGVTVLALSQWHKTYMQRRYPTAEIVVTSNGIDPERFDKKIQRISHRLIYAQSPDRGLDRVLHLFPKIRATYPDATLEVFYGFDMARERNPGFIAAIEEKAKQPGVTLHGRIGQDELAEEYLKADALLYPATMPSGHEFTETYCISVVEALAAGCFPVTTDHGALRETNRGGALVRVDTFDTLGDRDGDALFQLMAFWRRPLKEQERIRDHGHEGKFDEKSDIDDMAGRRWARLQTWERVASQWEELCASESAPDISRTTGETGTPQNKLVEVSI